MVLMAPAHTCHLSLCFSTFSFYRALAAQALYEWLHKNCTKYVLVLLCSTRRYADKCLSVYFPVWLFTKIDCTTSS